MGNKITRITRRTFKIKKKKSKNNGRQRHINMEPECQCNMLPDTRTTPICIKCVSGIMQDLEINRFNGRGHWRIIENSNLPNCGAQFDAKKFDKIFKLHSKQKYSSDEFDDESENYDDSHDDEFEDAQSDFFQKEKNLEIHNKPPSEVSIQDCEARKCKALEINNKKSLEEIEDCDNHSNNSYSSTFEFFEKLERDAMLNSNALDEMFFYPAFGDGAECDGSVKTNNLDEIQQIDDTHLYDTVASSEESNNVIISKSSQNTSLSARQLKSTKPVNLKFHGKKHEAGKSKKVPFHVIHCDETQHKPIPFNNTQFDTKQFDDTKFDGMLFNDSQFDAKYFDATQFDVTSFFDSLTVEKPQINSVSKLDSAPPKLYENHPFKESQFHAVQFDAPSKFKVLKYKDTKFDNEIFKATENQCDDVKFVSTILNAERSQDVTEYEAALIRTAEFVASHFGSERLNDSHIKSGTKDFFAAAQFCPTQLFNGSQFDAKQFDVSQFSLKQFDATQFTASQFDAKAFDAQKCGKFTRNNFESSFNVAQFDAKLFNATQFDLRQVCAK